MREYRVGERVQVRTLSGAVSQRVVGQLSDEGNPLLCTAEEFELARRDGREPLVIGWPSEFILEPVSA